MFQRSIPPLAQALAAAAAFHLHAADREAELQRRFRDALRDLDKADKEYRRSIERTLPGEAATRMLDAMAAFRAQASAVRESARAQLEELYRRYNRSYGAFDPLAPSAPPAAGLSHADGTRTATICDNARAKVDELRAQANSAVLQTLSREQIETLTAAKRARREAFEAAIQRALAPQSDAKALYQLVELAEGWY